MIQSRSVTESVHHKCVFGVRAANESEVQASK